MQCFAETRFEEAGECFLNGDLDPRVVLSFYPDLIGSLLSSEDSVTLYSGIEECLPSETSVEDISEYLVPPFTHTLSFYRFGPINFHCPDVRARRRLMNSCYEPSQELLAIHVAEHTVRSADDGTEDDIPRECADDAGEAASRPAA